MQAKAKKNTNKANNKYQSLSLPAQVCHKPTATETERLRFWPGLELLAASCLPTAAAGRQYFLLTLFTHLHWRKTHVVSVVCVRNSFSNAKCAMCLLFAFFLLIFSFLVFKFSFLCQTPALRSFISLSDGACIKRQLNVHWTLLDLNRLSPLC